MPNYILRFERDGETRYMEWSTISDAPSSKLMTREAFEKHYLYNYGIVGAEELAGRIARADQRGCSVVWCDLTLQECIAENRAGPGESCLTESEIWDLYVDRSAPAQSDEDQIEDLERQIAHLRKERDEARSAAEDFRDAYSQTSGPDGHEDPDPQRLPWER